jgi:DNA repair exonuclease SbcCD nuclease subunit
MNEMKSENANETAKMFSEAGGTWARFDQASEKDLLELGARLDPPATFADWEVNRKSFVEGYLKVTGEGDSKDASKDAKKRANSGWQYLRKRINLIRGYDLEKPKAPEKVSRRPTDPEIAKAWDALEAAKEKAKSEKQKRQKAIAKERETLKKVVSALAKLAGEGNPAALAGLKTLAKAALEKEASLKG